MTHSGHARLRLNNRAVCCTCSRPVLARRDASLRRTDWVAIGGIADMPKSVAKVRMRRD